MNFTGIKLSTIHKDEKNHKPCKICGKFFFKKGSAKCCSKECSIKNRNLLTKKFFILNKSKIKEYSDNFKKTHNGYMTKYSKKYYEMDKMKYREVRMRYNHKHKEAIKIYNRLWHRQQNYKLRMKVFDLLGHLCVNCGFSDKRALQFDHKLGGGTRIRKSTESNYREYLKNIDKTKKEIQVLCCNCNWIKRYENNELELSRYHA